MDLLIFLMAQYNIVAKFGVFTDTSKQSIKKCQGSKGKQYVEKKVCRIIYGFSGAGSYVFPHGLLLHCTKAPNGHLEINFNNVRDG